jgi:hypothetical protein
MGLLSTRTTFLAVLFLGLFALAARNVTDPDIWWHLKTGQLIVDSKSIPHTDPFSYTRAGEPWIAHEWLTDVLLYELLRAAGWAGLITAFAAVLCAAFFLLYLRCGANLCVAGVATLVAAFATRPVWGVRPQTLSLLLISLWLLILERSECTPKILWWTLPLTLLWVNLHAGFALGLVVYALFLAGEWLEGKIGTSRNPQSIRLAVFIFVLDLAIVPLNPNGMKLFWYPIQTLRSAAMQNYIAEWASPNFHRAEYLPFLLIVLGLLAASSWSGIRIRPRDLLLLIVSLFAALGSIRLIPLFVLVAVPLLAKQMAASLQMPPAIQSRRRNLPVAVRGVLNSVIILSMATFVILHTVQIIQRQPEAEKQLFPEAAVAFLQSHPPGGPIFNHYDWGGYLTWKLYPSVRVFIDGRADVYGEQFLHQFADTYQFKGDWQQTLQLWNINTVLVPANSALATGLRRAPGWTVSYEDVQAVILNRSRKAALGIPSAGSAFAGPVG